MASVSTSKYRAVAINGRRSKAVKLVSNLGPTDFSSDKEDIVYTAVYDVASVSLSGATIVAGSGNDVLIGAERNDILVGGAGNDTAFGGAGDDTIIGDGTPELSTLLVAKALFPYANSNNFTGLNAELTTRNSDPNLNAVRNIGAHNLSGGDGNDWIIAASNDSVFGGNGNDFIFTAGANAQINGEAGNDTIVGINLGSGAINGGDGDDFVYLLNSQSNPKDFATVGGGKGNDRLIVNSTAYSGFVLDGGIGNDTISVSGSGYFVVTGGAGDDYIDASAASTDSNAAWVTASGGDGNNTIIGSKGDDSLSAGAGNNSIVAGDGNDAVLIDLSNDASTASMTINGGNGSDTLTLKAIVDDATDAFLKNIVKNFGTYKPTSITVNGKTINLSNIENFVWSRTVIYSGTGGTPGKDYGPPPPITNVFSCDVDNGYADASGYMAGGAIITGCGLNDTLIGSKSNDSIYVQAGSNSVNGGDGKDKIYLDSATNAAATVVVPVSASNSKAYYIQPSNAFNVLNNTVDGGSGNDTVFGTAKDDALSLFDDDGTQLIRNVEWIAMGAGADLVDLTGGPSTASAFYIDGGNGDDSLIGGNGSSWLWGGDGNDLLVSGSGSEYLSGGVGNNTYLYLANSALDQGNDTIFCFDTDSDTLVLDRNLFGGQDLYAVPKISTDGMSVILTFGNGIKGSITFSYYNPTVWSNDDAKAKAANLQDKLAKVDGTVVRFLASANGLSGDGASQEGTKYDDNIVLSNGSFSANGYDGNDFIDARLTSTSETLNGGAGVDTLLGGAGIDTFVFTGQSSMAESSINQMDIVKGFTKNDILSFNVSSTNTKYNTTNGTYNGTLTNNSSIGYLTYFMYTNPNNTAYQANLFKDGKGLDRWSQITIGNDSYVFVDANGNGAFDIKSDIVVKLENYTSTLTGSQFNFNTSLV